MNETDRAYQHVARIHLRPVSGSEQEFGIDAVAAAFPIVLNTAEHESADLAIGVQRQQ